jgi:hypothetical protein
VPETGRDQHCVVWDAVSLNLFEGNEAAVPDERSR